MDVLDGVAAVCVDVTTEVWLVNCAEVPRLMEGEDVDLSVVREEMEVITVVLEGTEELAAVD